MGAVAPAASAANPDRRGAGAPYGRASLSALVCPTETGPGGGSLAGNDCSIVESTRSSRIDAAKSVTIRVQNAGRSSGFRLVISF